MTGDNFKLHPQKCDCDLKSKIKTLTDSINLGERDQTVLDKYVFAYFASCTGHAILRRCDWRQLVVRDQDLFSTKSCRDIGYCVRNIILNNTDEDMLCKVIYNSLPYMKHNRLNFPTFDTCTYTALTDIVRIVLGCCLGTFKGHKRPPWHMRVNLVVFVHELLSRGNKRDLYLFCTSHTSLVRISAIDYFIHFLEEYMPIEKHTIARMMTKRESVDMLQLSELKNAMNNFRITCYENSELNFTEINAKAVVTLERCNRLCGQKIKNRQSDAPRLAKIDLSLFQYAMSQNLSLDLVAHVLHPELTSEQMLKFNYMQNVITVNPLISQFRDKQMASIRLKAASNTTKVAHSLNCFVCMSCVETFTELDKKMRLGEDNALFCMKCRSNEYIVKINCFGVVLAINARRYFWCPHCCLVHAWTSSGFELDYCALQHDDAKASHTDVCFFCRKSLNLEDLTILDSRVGIRHKIHACYKHRPWLHQMKYIHDAASYKKAMELKNNSKIIY